MEFNGKKTEKNEKGEKGSAAPTNRSDIDSEDKVILMSSIMVNFFKEPWERNIGNEKWLITMDERIRNTIDVLWKKAISEGYLDKRYIPDALMRKKKQFYCYAIRFQNYDGKFPAKFIADFVNFMSLVEPELYNLLQMVVYDSTMIFGPKHRVQCSESNRNLNIPDEICLKTADIKTVITKVKDFYSEADIPTSRAGLLEIIQTFYGKDQTLWPDAIMMDFYEMLWEIVGAKGKFTFNNVSDAKKWFSTNGYTGSSSNDWDNIQTSFPIEKITEERFGKETLKNIYKRFLDASSLALNCLKPKLRNVTGWLEDSEIQSALDNYNSVPENHFYGIVLRLSYGANKDEFTPFSSMWVEKPKNVTKFAFVMNTNPIENSGTHWVSLFVDVEENEINYMDSIGSPPNSVVQHQIREALNLLRKWFPNFTKKTFDQFTTRKQKGGIECGVYSVSNIVQRLKGVPFHELDMMPLSDEQCHLKRKVFWR